MNHQRLGTVTQMCLTITRSSLTKPQILSINAMHQFNLLIDIAVKIILIKVLIKRLIDLVKLVVGLTVINLTASPRPLILETEEAI